jgi:hypothetical protein
MPQQKYGPTIHANNEYIKQEPYPLCEGKGCRNVVSRHLLPRLCSLCRKSRRWSTTSR